MAGDFVKHKKDSDTTSVWSYYLVAKDGNSAKCKRCPAILKTLGGSTKGLHTHLLSKHNIKVISASTSQDSENLNTAPPPAKRKLDDYFTKSADDSLDDILNPPSIYKITHQSTQSSDLVQQGSTMALILENTKILEFLELVGRLKHVKRTGWVLCDIDECESIAGHMYRMGLMTFLLTEENNPTNLDRFKCLQIALVHDLAECIVGDITPHCGVSPEEKHRREDEAMKKIAELTGIAGDRMYDLYKEYENQTSPEAKFAKDLDRYDMILQAFEYEKREKTPKKLQEFFTATEGKFNHPFIQALVKELNKQREEFENKYLINGSV